jgi:AcrR family transcriptional regulator
VVSNQRERIIDSLAQACAAKGYRAATVEDIIAAAGVSRRTFYELFADKQECFLVAYELVMDRMLVAVGEAYGAGRRAWPERIAAGLMSLLEFFAADPVLARLVMVEVLAAGRAALERRDAQLKRFEKFFEPGREALPAELANQRLLARAVVGGLSEALYARIAAGGAERLPEAGPKLVYSALVPYLGHPMALAISGLDKPGSGAVAE